MDRHQREKELREMLTTQRGKEELLATLKKHAGIEEGNLPPFGALLVDTILNYEYPGEPDARAEIEAASEPSRNETTTESSPPSSSTSGESARTTPAREKLEPGDVKFDQPPGQEAPGG